MPHTIAARWRRGSWFRPLAAGTVFLASLSLTASAQHPAARPPNRLGRVPILEYHLVGDKDSRWGRSRERFRRDLQLLYDRGYRPITVAQLVDGDIDIP